MVESALLIEANRILVSQGILGFITLCEGIAIVVLFRMMMKRDDENRKILQDMTSKCMICVKGHDKQYNEITDTFGEHLGEVYRDMRTDATALRQENIKIQEATTDAIVRTGDSLNGLTSLVNRLVGMLGRGRNGVV